MLARGILAFSRAFLQRGKTPIAAATRCGTTLRSLHLSRSQFTVYYTKDHEWISVNGDVGTVGITEHAREQLGDIVYCDLPEVGSEFASGDSMAVVESVKAASDLYSPVSGEVVEIHDKFASDPSIFKEAPALEVWLVKMKLTNVAELDGLLNAEEYAKEIEE